MSVLKNKAKEIFVEKLEQESDVKQHGSLLADSIDEKKIFSQIRFQQRISAMREDFQKNLLDAAKRGEVLKIDILSIDKTFFQENHSIDTLEQYLPIQEKVVLFLKDTSFEFLTDNIIEDEDLRILYKTIVQNDIYPEWQLRDSEDGLQTILYLEASPINDYTERYSVLEEKLDRRRRVEESAQIQYNQNVQEMKKERKRDKIKDFLLIFFPTLYIAVTIFTVLVPVFGITPMDPVMNTFGLIAIAWPLFLFGDLQGALLFPIPLGVLYAIYFAGKRI